MNTPVKAIKGKNERSKRYNIAYNDLFSKAVSTIEQPVEPSFNWLIEKTDIKMLGK